MLATLDRTVIPAARLWIACPELADGRLRCPVSSVGCTAGQRGRIHVAGRLLDRDQVLSITPTIGR